MRSACPVSAPELEHLPLWTPGVELSLNLRVLSSISLPLFWVLSELPILLKHERHTAHNQPHRCICPVGREEVFTCSTREPWLQEGPTSPGRPEHATNSDLAMWLLLSVREALLQPMPMWSKSCLVTLNL